MKGMKYICLLAVVLSAYYLTNAQIAINTDGSDPDNSASATTQHGYHTVTKISKTNQKKLADDYQVVQSFGPFISPGETRLIGVPIETSSAVTPSVNIICD